MWASVCADVRARVVVVVIESGKQTGCVLLYLYMSEGQTEDTLTEYLPRRKLIPMFEQKITKQPQNDIFFIIC